MDISNVNYLHDDFKISKYKDQLPLKNNMQEIDDKQLEISKSNFEKDQSNLEDQIKQIEKNNLNPEISYQDGNKCISLFSLDGLLVTQTTNLDTGEKKYYPNKEFFSYKEGIGVDTGLIIKNDS